MFEDKKLSAIVKQAARAHALQELQILDTETEPEFDAITEAAARLMDCKISLISLIDRDRQWFKSRHNVAIAQTPIDWSFCQHAVELGETLIVEDARYDPRFADNPLVTGDPEIRFYAGVPIGLKRDADGSSVAFGTLCVIDSEAKSPTAETLEALHKLALLTEALLEARLNTNKLRRERSALADALAVKSRMHRQLQQAERMSGIGSWRFTISDGVTDFSPQVKAIYGIPLDENISVIEALEYFPEPDRSKLRYAINRCSNNGEPYDLELDFINARNCRRRVHAIGELELKAGKPEAMIGVLQDVTDKHELETSLRHVANTDELTGLASRRHFLARADELITDAIETGGELALVLIDLDHFKQVNDTKGHRAGDNVLRQVAATISSDWLRGSFAARLGGDEFVLLLNDRDLTKSLETTIARILKELRVSDLEEGGGRPHRTVTATLGIAFLGPDTNDAMELLANADTALYRAKDQGRGGAAIHRREVLLS